MSGSLLDNPMAICVAPNGARKTHADHPAVPVTPQEVAEGAVRWREAGAAMLHLHVRDRNAGHVLDADLYIESTKAVRAAVGDDMVIQITTEAVGKYSAPEQMAVVRAVKPEACSLAVRELIPDAAHEKDAATFLEELVGWGCAPQYILYSPEDVDRLRDLRRRGIIPGTRMNVLFVLGRYSRDQESDPRDLLPFVERWDSALTGRSAFAPSAEGRAPACWHRARWVDTRASDSRTTLCALTVPSPPTMPTLSPRRQRGRGCWGVESPRPTTSGPSWRLADRPSDRITGG